MIGILEQNKNISGGGGGGGSIPLTNALSLMSFRKVNPAYSGFCVRVRRDSDNLDLDVGFISDYVDTAAIAAHCSGTTGHVAIWYDQSGLGNNFTNMAFSGVAALPKVYQAGAFFIDSGKIGINITGNERIEPYSASDIPFKSCFAVVKMGTLATLNYLMFRGAPKVDGLFLGGSLGGANGFGVVENNAVRFSNSIENTNRNLQSFIGTSPKKVYTNGANLATEGGTTADLNIGSISRPSFPINGNIQEMLIYSDDKDSERVAIESDINSYYSIY